MRLLLCVALLLGSCSTPSVDRYRKPDNNIHRENLQEKFDTIDANDDGVIDKAEAKNHEEGQLGGRVGIANESMWVFFQILGFMALACFLPWAFTLLSRKIRGIREAKRIS